MERFLKNYAKSNELKIQHKAATGHLQGHAVTISEGKEIVKISMSTYFDDANKQQDFEEALNRKLLSRDLRVLELKFLSTSIDITLSYRLSTDILNVEAFVNYFFPLLIQYGAVRASSNIEVSSTNEATSRKRFAFF